MGSKKKKKEKRNHKKSSEEKEKWKRKRKSSEEKEKRKHRNSSAARIRGSKKRHHSHSRESRNTLPESYSESESSSHYSSSSSRSPSPKRTRQHGETMGSTENFDQRPNCNCSICQCVRAQQVQCNQYAHHELKRNGGDDRLNNVCGATCSPDGGKSSMAETNVRHHIPNISYVCDTNNKEMANENIIQSTGSDGMFDNRGSFLQPAITHVMSGQCTMHRNCAASNTLEKKRCDMLSAPTSYAGSRKDQQQSVACGCTSNHEAFPNRFYVQICPCGSPRCLTISSLWPHSLSVSMPHSDQLEKPHFTQENDVSSTFSQREVDERDLRDSQKCDHGKSSRHDVEKSSTSTVKTKAWHENDDTDKASRSPCVHTSASEDLNKSLSAQLSVLNESNFAEQGSKNAPNCEADKASSILGEGNTSCKESTVVVQPQGDTYNLNVPNIASAPFSGKNSKSQQLGDTAFVEKPIITHITRSDTSITRHDAAQESEDNDANTDKVFVKDDNTSRTTPAKDRSGFEALCSLFGANAMDIRNDVTLESRKNSDVLLQEDTGSHHLDCEDGNETRYDCDVARSENSDEDSGVQSVQESHERLQEMNSDGDSGVPSVQETGSHHLDSEDGNETHDDRDVARSEKSDEDSDVQPVQESHERLQEMNSNRDSGVPSVQESHERLQEMNSDEDSDVSYVQETGSHHLDSEDGNDTHHDRDVARSENSDEYGTLEESINSSEVMRDIKHTDSEQSLGEGGDFHGANMIDSTLPEYDSEEVNPIRKMFFVQEKREMPHQKFSKLIKASGMQKIIVPGNESSFFTCLSITMSESGDFISRETISINIMSDLENNLSEYGECLKNSVSPEAFKNMCADYCRGGQLDRENIDVFYRICANATKKNINLINIDSRFKKHVLKTYDCTRYISADNIFLFLSWRGHRKKVQHYDCYVKQHCVERSKEFINCIRKVKPFDVPASTREVSTSTSCDKKELVDNPGFLQDRLVLLFSLLFMSVIAYHFPEKPLSFMKFSWGYIFIR